VKASAPAPFKIKPPAFGTHYQGKETTRVLRAALSSPLSDGMQPMAVCQKAVRTETKFAFLNEVGFFGLYPSNDNLAYRNFGDLPEADRARAGGLSIDLQKDFAPYAAFATISHQHGLGRDRYMDTSANYLVVRFANIALLMWDMDEKRAAKIIQFPHENNPTAAFGVLVSPPLLSSHARLSHMRALEQANRFLVLFARYAYPGLSIEFEPQTLPKYQ
jgi:hypothetical protein